MVMQDLQTKSLWSQISGVCISGAMEGKRLEIFQGSHTTFGDFRKLYPEGLLLTKPEKGEKGSPYDSYYSNRDKLGIFGRENNYSDLDGKDIIFGVRSDGRQTAVSKKYLKENRFALLTEYQQPILLTYSDNDETVTAFSPDYPLMDNPENITIEKNRISLRSENIVWDSRTGISVDGKAEDLKRAPVITAYWFAWINFFPDTKLIK